MGADLNAAILKLAERVGIQEVPERRARCAIPFIGPTKQSRYDEQDRRDAKLFQDWYGYLRKIAVPVVEGHKHRTSGQRSPAFNIGQSAVRRNELISFPLEQI
jgi:hypothetical protein